MGRFAWLTASCAAAALLATCAGAKGAAPIAWREVEPGLEYARVALGSDEPHPAHLFRADLSRWRAVALDAKALTGARSATIAVLAERAGVPVAVNATFFDEKGAPLGLLRGEGKRHNPLRGADWGVLAVEGSAATLVHTREFEDDESLDFAVQCGPRAVVGGKPTKLKPQGASARTALCIPERGTLLVLATEGLITAADLAQWLASPAPGGPGCRDALLLDGGPSTQMKARAGDVSIDLPGGWPVPNGVGLAPR